MIQRKEYKKQAKGMMKVLYWRNVLLGFVVTITALGALNSALSRFVGNSGNTFSVYDFIKSCIKFSAGKDFLSYTENSPAYQQVLFPLLNLILAIAVTFFTRNYTLPIYVAYTLVGHDFENVSGKAFPSEIIFYIVMAYVVYLLFTFLLLKPFNASGRSYFLKRAKKEETTGGEMFFAFNRYYLNIIWIEFYKSFFLTLWSFTIFGGIIKYFQYCFVDEIIAENPTLKPKEVIQISKAITKNHLFDIFKFSLSFLGYMFLNVITLGLVGFFFYHSYEYLSKANLYVGLKEEAIKKDMTLVEKLDFIDENSSKGLIERTGNTGVIRYSVSDYILIFFVVAIGGWIWEVSLHFVQTLSFTNRGSLWGPWIPIYGFGAIGALFLIRRTKKYPWLVFLLSLVLCSGIEYLTGWIFDLLRRPLWNYYGLPLSLPYHHNPGYICFYGCMAFGFACTFAVYYAGPYFYSLFHKIPTLPKWIICSVLLAGIIVDSCITLFYKMNPGGVDESGLEQISLYMDYLGIR